MATDNADVWMLRWGMEKVTKNIDNSLEIHGTAIRTILKYSWCSTPAIRASMAPPHPRIQGYMELKNVLRSGVVYCCVFPYFCCCLHSLAVTCI